MINILWRFVIYLGGSWVPVSLTYSWYIGWWTALISLLSSVNWFTWCSRMWAPITTWSISFGISNPLATTTTAVLTSMITVSEDSQMPLVNLNVLYLQIVNRTFHDRGIGIQENFDTFHVAISSCQHKRPENRKNERYKVDISERISQKLTSLHMLKGHNKDQHNHNRLEFSGLWQRYWQSTILTLLFGHSQLRPLRQSFELNLKSLVFLYGPSNSPLWAVFECSHFPRFNCKRSPPDRGSNPDSQISRSLLYRCAMADFL